MEARKVVGVIKVQILLKLTVSESVLLVLLVENICFICGIFFLGLNQKCYFQHILLQTFRTPFPKTLHIVQIELLWM